MSSTEIYAALTEIFRDIFLDDEMQLSPTLSARDVDGWDSFKQIEIILATEARFGIRLKTKEINNLLCVGDLAAVIAGHAEAKA